MDCYKIRLLSQPRAVVSAVRHLWTTIHLFGSIMNIPAAVCRRLFTERMSHRTNKHLIKVKGMKLAWKAGAERCSEESLYQLKLFLPHKGPVDGWKWKRHSEITWGGGCWFSSCTPSSSSETEKRTGFPSVCCINSRVGN